MSNPDFVCKKCGACCRNWDLPLNADPQKLAKNIKTIPFEAQKAVIRLYGKCKHLKDDNTCSIYWRRPNRCIVFECGG